jgi:tetratricopeptide (TPR) repeat protein
VLCKSKQYYLKLCLPPGEGTTLNNIALIYRAQGDYTTALTHFTNSLAISQEIGNKAGESTTLNNISQIYHAQGDYTTALTYLNNSLAIRQEIGDKAGEGAILNNISQIYYEVSAVV